ncbi:MAG: hypothetical protein ACJ76H_11355 [Bacteriovoracaceae bacterium]
MKSAFLLGTLLVSVVAHANVVELEDATAKNVIEVYEEMREQEVGATDNRWIHDFEKEHMGKEMDHLSRLKRTAETHEEM